MKDKRKLLLALIGSLLLLSTFVVVSYAYFLSNIDINNTSNVNTAIENMANFSFNANSTPSIELNVSFSNMFDSVLGVASQNSVTENISLSSTDSIPIFCTYDIVWVWNEAADSQNQYTKTLDAINEYVVSGTNGEESFEEVQVSNYGQTKVLYSGFLTSSTPTPTVEVWTYNVKFYNIDANQNAHMGSLYSSRIEVQNVNCDLGLGENGYIIADANHAFVDPNSFASKILADNGGKATIEAKTPPEFSEQAPALTYVEETLPSGTSTATPNEDYYFTFANSYTVNPITGKYTLKNNDETNVTISNNVKSFNELAIKLQELNQLGEPMYVGEVSGTTSGDSLYAWSNRFYLYKVESINTQLGTLSYKLLLPIVSDVDNTADGVYATDDDYTAITGRKSYYFRGAVDNNWVSFAGYYWRIIRINGDGSIRIMYSGTIAPTEETKVVITNSSTQLSGRAFNTTQNSAEYVGWKYTMGENHGYANSSTIKGDDSSPAVGSLDEWYYSNIANNSTYLNKINQNQILCNDRTSYTSTTGTTPASGTGTAYQIFGPYIRNIARNEPSLICPDNRDKFTVDGVPIGNESLTYPVGLITADEVKMAGLIYASYNPKNYLYNSRYYWTASPYYFSNGIAYALRVDSYGSLDGRNVAYTIGARPVVSLKSDIAVTGTGQYNDPYVVN